MKHYLYGLTIHSIQGYIFQTNKLKEIAGASELVEQICTTKFAEKIGKDEKGLELNPNAIRNAAGNVRYLFDDSETCKEVVRTFPKEVLEFAPGIHISQAVVEIAETDEFQEKSKELERKLTEQRNNPIRPVDLGYIAINRSRRTGLPSVERKTENKEDLINDRVTKCKREIFDITKKTNSRVNSDFFGNDDFKDRMPEDFETMVSSNPNNTEYGWLAVIHADGNNMGQALQNLGNRNAETLKAFSKAVDLSTKNAAKKAFSEAMPKEELGLKGTIPFRPIIVGGDDLTVICRADLALKFAKAYLEQFEIETSTNFKDAKLSSLQNGLTACAGIAFVKVSYPFHYAINLAEKLCTHAKTVTKMNFPDVITPSCFMFHKVQDSFVEEYSEIIKRELTAKASNFRFDFGPYYIIDKNKELTIEPTIDGLLKSASFLHGKEGNAIKSSLRQWLTDLHNNKDMADQRMNRLLSVGNDKIIGELKLKNTKGKIGTKSPVYDWLTVLSINPYND